MNDFGHGTRRKWKKHTALTNLDKTLGGNVEKTPKLLYIFLGRSVSFKLSLSQKLDLSGEGRRPRKMALQAAGVSTSKVLVLVGAGEVSKNLIYFLVPLYPFITSYHHLCSLYFPV